MNLNTPDFKNFINGFDSKYFIVLKNDNLILEKKSTWNYMNRFFSNLLGFKQYSLEKITRFIQLNSSKIFVGGEDLRKDFFYEIINRKISTYNKHHSKSLQYLLDNSLLISQKKETLQLQKQTVDSSQLKKTGQKTEEQGLKKSFANLERNKEGIDQEESNEQPSSILSHEQKDLQNLTSNREIEATISKEPIKYEKGKQKTRDVIPTKKEELARGCSGRIHLHKNNETCVVKKSEENLLKEYELGIQIKHANIVSMRGLYIKHYTNEERLKYKLLIDKIDGQTIKNYSENSENLSQQLLCHVLLQAQDCCLYLFEQKVTWSDLNIGNIFITKDKNLKLCDFGYWLIQEEPKERAQQLVLGCLEIAGNLIKNSVLVKNQTHEKECALIYPEFFFGEKIIEEYIVNSTYGISPGFGERSWMKTIKEKLALIDETQIKDLLKSYFDHVIQNISKNEV